MCIELLKGISNFSMAIKGTRDSNELKWFLDGYMQQPLHPVVTTFQEYGVGSEFFVWNYAYIFPHQCSVKEEGVLFCKSFLFNCWGFTKL